MVSDLPATFLQRISTYPIGVQDVLKSELGEGVARDVLGVLHGAGSVDEKKITSLLDKSMPADAFIGRMLLSKKFLQRVSRIPRILQSGESAEIHGIVADFITPLGDPDRPYIYKLREILGSGETSTLTENVSLLVGLIDFQHRAADYPADARQIAVQEILASGTDDATPFLPCLLEALGAASGFRVAKPMPNMLTLAAGTAFVATVLGPTEPPRLENTDIETLRSLKQIWVDASSVSPPKPPQTLSIVLTGRSKKAAAPYWEALRETGLVENIGPGSEFGENAGAELVLTLPAGLPVSPLFVACLCVLDLADKAISFYSDRRQTSVSWDAHITGYPDGNHDPEVGRFYKNGSTGQPVLRVRVVGVPLDSQAPQAAMARLAQPENCYAILVKLDDKANPDIYLNADQCLVIDGLDGMLAQFADAPAVIRQKPVVLLSARSSVDPTYVINAVQNYWAYSGRYPITLMQLEYDGDTSLFHLEAATDATLSHLALTDQTILPMSIALDVARRADGGMLEAGLLLMPDHPIVQDGNRILPTEEALTACRRRLNSAQFGPEQLEAVFLAGAANYRSLADNVAISHWPIAQEVRKANSRNAQLESALRKFATSPTSELADSVMQTLVETEDSLHLLKKIDGFAVKLSMNPEILAAMESTSLQEFLKLARQIPSSDEIATNLMTLSSALCRQNFNYIIPFFELLACNLTSEALQVTLAFVAADLTDHIRRAQYRLGECIRRYGSAEIMIQHLALLHRNGSDLLSEPNFMRHYQRVLTSDGRAALHALIGGKAIGIIAETIGFRDSFKQALVGKDRATLIEMLQDSERTRDVDFIGWMDSLRSHSNELCEMAVPVTNAAFAQLSNVYGNKLMATVFSDTATLNSMNEAGLFEDGTDLSLIARNILRDNTPLNAMLSETFNGSSIVPLCIEGETAAQVFANAAKSSQGKEAGTSGPTVSVIISAFNADLDLFRLSLASVLNQTHSPVEVFVVDDASEPENSAALRAEVEGLANVTYMRVDQNSGPYVGRNLAIEAASGDFIAIQDADDWSHPDRFAQQLAVLAQNLSTQLVTSPHIRIDKYGRVQMEAQFSILGDGPMTSMFRRSAFDKVGVFAQVRSRGDVEMRERIRSYFGNHALQELALPMMLCFADSATLSQKTKSEKHEFLQLFRSNISGRRPLGNLRRTDVALGPINAISVPRALRPTSQGV